MRFLKKVVVASVLLLTMSVYLLSERTSVRVHAKVFGGPPLGFTGAPDEGTCIGCHYTFGQPNVPGSGGSVALSGLPATYSPGQTYTVTVTVVHPTARRWGFETTPIDAAGTSSTVGTLTILDQVRTIKREAVHEGTVETSPAPILLCMSRPRYATLRCALGAQGCSQGCVPEVLALKCLLNFLSSPPQAVLVA